MIKFLERLKLEALNAHNLVLVATLALPVIVIFSIISKPFALLVAGSIAAGGVVFYMDMKENDILDSEDSSELDE